MRARTRVRAHARASEDAVGKEPGGGRGVHDHHACDRLRRAARGGRTDVVLEAVVLQELARGVLHAELGRGGAQDGNAEHLDGQHVLRADPVGQADLADGVAAVKAASEREMRSLALLSSELCADDPYAVQLAAAELGDAGADAIAYSGADTSANAHDHDHALAHAAAAPAAPAHADGERRRVLCQQRRRPSRATAGGAADGGANIASVRAASNGGVL